LLFLLQLLSLNLPYRVSLLSMCQIPRPFSLD
jgi:hypothetical protein